MAETAEHALSTSAVTLYKPDKETLWSLDRIKLHIKHVNQAVIYPYIFIITHYIDKEHFIILAPVYKTFEHLTLIKGFKANTGFKQEYRTLGAGRNPAFYRSAPKKRKIPHMCGPRHYVLSE